MQLQPAQAEWLRKPCNREGFRISSPVPQPAVMNPKPSVLRPLLAGLFVTLAQIFVAVVLIAPPGPLSFRYDTLIQHDSHWFANIVDRGYGTTLPPSSPKMMEVSNVAFFPAYPALAALLRYGLNLSTSRCAAHYRPDRGLGFLELLFSLLRSLEHLAPPAIFRSSLYRGASNGVLPGGWLFRVAVHDGAFWLHVLE